MNKSISIIVPFLNESDNIPELLKSFDQFLKNENLLQSEVLFVDDGSTDDSIKIFKSEFVKYSFNARIIKLAKNFGSHAAVRAGLLNANGDYAIFLPADLQDPLELILHLAKKIDEGYDVIFATRDNTATGILPKIFTKIYSALMRKYVNDLYPENGFDVVFFNRKIINCLNANIERNSSVMLQILNLGFNQAFVPYKKLSRNAGKSKWTLAKKIKLFFDSFIAFSYAPIRFVTLVGIILFILGVIFSIYLIARKLFYNDLMSGWPMLISILSIGFGITNISLGVIAEYLWRTLDETRERPVFIIDEIHNLK